jgi:hypothetical protein
MRGRIPAEDVAPLQSKTAEIKPRQFANSFRDSVCRTKGWAAARRSQSTHRRSGRLDSEWRQTGRREPTALVGVEGFNRTDCRRNHLSRGPRFRPERRRLSEAPWRRRHLVTVSLDDAAMRWTEGRCLSPRSS